MKENLLVLKDLFIHTTAISKQTNKKNSINVLDDIVNKCNNTVHRTIKMKPIEVTPNSKKILSLKLVILLEFQNTKTILLKDMFQISQKKFLLLAKLKIQFL